MDFSFWEEAEQCIEQFNYPQAAKIYKEALRKRSNDPEILDALGDVLLLMGEVEQAQQVLTVSLKLAPETGSSKFLNLGQLSEGPQALQFYKKGVEILLKEKNNNASPESLNIINEKIISALSAMAEIYMTDECMADNAEEECQKYLQQALSIDPNNTEALQLMASCKISQQENEEAIKYLTKSKKTWINLERDDMPPFEFRLQSAKLFVELEQYETAAEILEMLLEEYDEIAEVWYLLGFAESFFDPESALENLTKSRELLVKTQCQEPSIFEQVDSQIKKIQQKVQNQNTQPQPEQQDANVNMDTSQ